MNPRMALKNCLAKNSAAYDKMYGVTETAPETDKNAEIPPEKDIVASAESVPKDEKEKQDQ